MEDVPALRGERRAGVLLHRGGVLAAGVALAVAVAAAVLVPVHGWRPLVVWPVLAVLVVLLVLGVRAVPVAPVPVWTAASVTALAVGHGLWAGLTHAEHVVLRRDAGSYAWYAHWIATRHGLPIPVDLAALGGPAAVADPSLTVGSPAFFQVGSGAGVHVVPQFLVGAPAVWSLGYWLAGWSGLLVAPAVVGAAAVLAVGGLAARLSGPRAAVLATAAVAVCQPVLHAARSPYSEPVALLLVAAAGSLLTDAVRGRGGGPRTSLLVPDGIHLGDRQRARLAAAAGAVTGLAGLVRIDSLREVILLLPVATVLALRGQRTARPLVVGALGAQALALAWALAFSRPYLQALAGSLLPLAAGGIAVAVVSGLALAWVRRRSRWPGGPAWLPAAGAGLVVAVGVLLALRPLFQVVRQSAQDPGSKVVAGLQAGQGLAVDGGRTYAEHSVVWLSWWVGPATLVMALVAFAVLAHRLLGRWRAGAELPAWFAPALVGLSSTLLTLYRPGITPDHPWADRRLVPVVLPAVLLAGSAAAAAAVGWARRRLPAAALVTTAVVACALVLVPTAAATVPVAGQHTEAGELSAVRQVCAALGPRDVVLAVDSRARAEWPQVLRDECGVASASLLGSGTQLAAAVGREAARVRAAGGTPVLLAANDLAPSAPPDVLTQLGLTPRTVVHLVTREDQRLLTRRPQGSERLVIWVRLAEAVPGIG